MSFFAGSPFASPVGQRIEQATDASLPSENWTLNMEICDIINETEDGPKDAIKAIRKRLQQNAGKNYTVVMYTLTVLETCVKNCGKRFHVLACNKEFVQELVKLIGPKNDPPTAVQEKVLSLIQSWADAFHQHTELAGVVQMYTDLKQKGIEFPMTDLDTMAPIHTPQRTVSDADVATRVHMAASTPGSVSPSAVAVVAGSPAPAAPLTAPQVLMPSQQTVANVGSLTTDQLAKLQSELDVVEGNMAVFNEMLSELTPGKEHPSDMELLQELHGTCQAMQHRLVELIGKLANDEVTAELLRVNDELNNLFLRYSRFENNRGRQPAAAAGAEADGTADSSVLGSGLAAAAAIGRPAPVGAVAAAAPTPAPAAAPAPASPLEGGTETSDLLKENQSVKPRNSKEKEDTEFDMFAQSRNLTYESSKTGGSTYQDNLDPDQVNGSLGAVAQTRSQPVVHNERDFDEMAAWLSDRPAASENVNVAEESLTSSEFERFLAERAAAGDSIPTAVPSVQSASGRPNHHRQLNKEADSESSLFAL